LNGRRVAYVPHRVKVLYALVVVAILAVPAPAAAHGALTSPVSRLAACGPEGESGASAACVAALAESGTGKFDDWDNLRLPNVAGRDREVIPDGQLCSAGIDRFRGLDLPRKDWPTTRLTAGAGFAFAYRGTIPHEGTFRLYVTRDGYDPTAPLAWSDLETKPFLTAKDPALRSGSYRIKGTLPAGKVGRHLIYTIWQNSSTPDTYYSCSDVVFAAAPAKAPAVAKATKAPATSAAAAPAQEQAQEPVAQQKPEPVATTSRLPLIGGGAAVVVVLGALFAVFLHRRRRTAPRRPW
jgi:predicted carbohydrate-binding protein with CBM5 and CBM33 domain